MPVPVPILRLEDCQRPWMRPTAPICRCGGANVPAFRILPVLPGAAAEGERRRLLQHWHTEEILAIGAFVAPLRSQLPPPLIAAVRHQSVGILNLAQPR